MTAPLQTLQECIAILERDGDEHGVAAKLRELFGTMHKQTYSKRSDLIVDVEQAKAAAFRTNSRRLGTLLERVSAALSASSAGANVVRPAPRFPTMLRKMWSGGEVQDWIDRNWNATTIETK